MFFDRDGDGELSTGEEGAAGVRVAWETLVFADADETGAFRLEVPDGDREGVVWASVPEGGTPGPLWTRASASGETDLLLPVRPLATSAEVPLIFVVASDSHLGGGAWTGDDLAAAIRQASAGDPAPRFLTVLGDVTQSNQAVEFATVNKALEGLTGAWVPVPGNHDLYDGGVAYRASWGPESYSFTTGGVHFVVLNSEMSDPDIVAFLERDLVGLSPDTRVVTFGHRPLEDELASAMRSAGVDAVFSGHWHANRVIEHDGMTEYGTQPFLMGGIDLTPAGYRIVTVEPDRFVMAHHAFVDRPVLRVIEPTNDRCAQDGSRILVAVEGGARLGEPTARVGDASIDLEPAGGWLWRGSLPELGPGAHSLEITSGGLSDGEMSAAATVSICGRLAEVASPTVAPWPQQQGGPEHTGAVALEPRLPYVHAWVSPVGGHLHQGAPVAVDGRIFASVTDLAAGSAGGVVALDALTGAELWRFTSPSSPRNSPAVDGDVVVVGTSDGVVHGLEAATGEPRWAVDLGEGVIATQSALWAAPAVRDGTAYIGVQRAMAAIEIATGDLLWSIDPYPDGVWLGSFAAAAVTEDAVIATFNRTSGLVALDRDDGAVLWRVEGDPVRAMHGAPLVAGNAVLVSNTQGDFSAVDLATGELRWSTGLFDGDDWTYAIAGNAALADELAVVPTQWAGLRGLDAGTGESRWRYDARLGPLRTTHYAAGQAAFQSSPVVMGDVVWTSDTSGLLAALDAATGEPKWQYDLGVPVTGGLAAVGELLLVPSFDGALHAFAPADTVPGAEPVDDIGNGGGCSMTGGGRDGSLWASLLILGLAQGGRAARRRRSIGGRRPHP